MGFASGVVKYLVFLANLIFAVSFNFTRVQVGLITYFLIFWLFDLLNNGRYKKDDLTIKVHLESLVLCRLIITFAWLD